MEKAIFFDFDGTLTGKSENPMQALLKKSGVPDWFYKKAINRYYGGVLHKMAKPKLLWSIFSKFFRFAGISKKDFDEIVENTKLLEQTKEALISLKKNGYHIFVISGGFRCIIDDVLGDCKDYFDDIMACDVEFDKKGKLKKIVSQNYDNEGKAKYITEKLAEYGINPENACFVGNDRNDIFAKKAGVKTFCLNPQSEKVQANNKEIWDGTQNDVDDLTQILPALFELTGNNVADKSDQKSSEPESQM